MKKVIDQLKHTHRKHRPKAEVLSIEEAIWFFIGIALGWLVARGLSLIVLVAVVVLFFVFLKEQFNPKGHTHNVFGEKVRK